MSLDHGIRATTWEPVVVDHTGDVAVPVRELLQRATDSATPAVEIEQIMAELTGNARSWSHG